MAGGRAPLAHCASAAAPFAVAWRKEERVRARRPPPGRGSPRQRIALLSPQRGERRKERVAGELACAADRLARRAVSPSCARRVTIRRSAARHAAPPLPAQREERGLGLGAGEGDGRTGGTEKNARWRGVPPTLGRGALACRRRWLRSEEG